MKLYELTAGWNRLREVLATATDPDEIASFQAAADEIAQGIQDKAENIAVFVKELEAEAEALKAEEKSLKERRATVENKAERLSEYLMNELRLAGLNKVDGTRARISLRRNPPRVVVRSLEALRRIESAWKPYKYDESNVDKTWLKLAIEQHLIDAGTATLESGESLLIK
jgi:hypothetical protein